MGGGGGGGGQEKVVFVVQPLVEPRYEKTGFLHMRKKKTEIIFAVTVKLISAFVFATWKVQSLYFLNPKFQASSHLLRLYSLVCVEPGRNPRRPVFSQKGTLSFYNLSCTYDVMASE